MRDEGLLKFYDLQNTSTQGQMPTDQLVSLDVEAFYANRTIGMQRLYLAKQAEMQLDKLVRCYNTYIPEDAKYVILEDGRQYRIVAINAIVDEDAVDLSLQRMGKNYEVADESP